MPSALYQIILSCFYLAAASATLMSSATNSYIMGWGGIADSKSLISSLAYAAAYFYIGTAINAVSIKKTRFIFVPYYDERQVNG